jgi:hypothetical protein
MAGNSNIMEDESFFIEKKGKVLTQNEKNLALFCIYLIIHLLA